MLEISFFFAMLYDHPMTSINNSILFLIIIFLRCEPSWLGTVTWCYIIYLGAFLP